jgi:hypothetical protein
LTPQWLDQCDKFKKPQNVMPRDVATRWNSTYDMLTFAIRYKDVIDAMCHPDSVTLKQYKLNVAEWALLTDLKEVLKVC